MAYPDFLLSFTVNCDASEKRLGAVFQQEQDGQMKVRKLLFQDLNACKEKLQFTRWKIRISCFKMGHY